METLSTGSFAYFDSFAGLIPAKVISISEDDKSIKTVMLKLTAKRGPYRKGEVIGTSTLWAIPRGAVRYKRYGATILPYRVQTDY